MTGAHGRTIAGLCGALASLVLLAAAPAGAQSITGLTAVKNAGNSPDNFQDGLTVSYQRTTTVGVLSNNGIVARVRYAEAVGVDVGAFSSQSNTQESEHPGHQQRLPGRPHAPLHLERQLQQQQRLPHRRRRVRRPAGPAGHLQRPDRR